MKHLIYFLLFISLPSYASHSVGADLTYQTIGANKYIVTLNFYRDCKGIPAPTTPFLSITSSCYSSTYLDLVPQDTVKVSSYCNGVLSTCDNGTYPGVIKYTYTGMITLPGKCSDWKFTYSLCCRNISITNLVDPAHTLMDIESDLDNGNGDISSPVFANDPAPFICAGQPFCFDSKATGLFDSIRYDMISPKQSANVDVDYSNGFTYSNPISSNPALTFNSTTGLVCMTPTYQEIDVFSIMVKGYKFGQIVSKVRRDIQVTITSCSCSPALPVELLSFVGRSEGDNNVLEWSTATEINNNFFIIERNGDRIAGIKGNGTTTIQHNYSFIDSEPLADNYYRLIQMDMDGISSYSKFIFIKHHFNDCNDLYPYNLLGQMINYFMKL